jgi:hypothetical protein
MAYKKKGKWICCRCQRWSMLEADGLNDFHMGEVGQRESWKKLRLESGLYKIWCNDYYCCGYNADHQKRSTQSN